MKQITKAMNMVSSSKLRRAENTKQFEPYMEKCKMLLLQLQVLVKILVIPCLDLDKFNVVATSITSDKGLAGAYSSNVLKRLINDIKKSILAVTNIALLY